LILFIINLIDEFLKIIHRAIYKPLEYDSRGLKVRYNRITNRKEFRNGWKDIDEINGIWRDWDNSK
jgi:hypothetical protein